MRIHPLHMKKPSLVVLSAAFMPVILVSCVDPVPPPPPKFRPNPPYPPEQVDPYADPSPDAQNRDSQNPDAQYPPTSPYGPSETAPATRPGTYPVAKPTTNPNEVVSPYPPNNIINVEGYRSGELVRDPHNKKIFRVP